MWKFKADDKVKITAGKDKGREGKIERVFLRSGLVSVANVNLYKKHLKGFQGQKAGIYDLPRPVPVANVVLVCPKCQKNTRVGWQVTGKTKVRVCKKCDQPI